MIPIQTLVLESYASNVRAFARSWGYADVDARAFAALVFALSTLLVWRATAFAASTFPRSVEAVRSLVLSAVFVFVFMLFYFF